MAIVVDLQLGWSLGAVCPHTHTIRLIFLTMTRRGVALVTIPVILPICQPYVSQRDYPGDLGSGFGSCAGPSAADDEHVDAIIPSPCSRGTVCRAQFSLAKHVIDHH